MWCFINYQKLLLIIIQNVSNVEQSIDILLFEFCHFSKLNEF